MPWKTMDVEDQRVRFVVEALAASKPLSQVCAEFGISLLTGYSNSENAIAVHTIMS
jgi:hypothetical protein